MDTISYSFNEEEPAGEMPAVDSSIITEVNLALEDSLSDNVLTPQSGFQRIRKVLFRYRLDMPALYDMDNESDELVLHILDMENKSNAKLYVIYSLNEEGYFEFYAEAGDSNRMDELISDEGNQEED